MAEGQKYPSALDPTKIDMPDSVTSLPAFDPTGKLEGLVFRDPAVWNPQEKEQSNMWNRVQKGA